MFLETQHEEMPIMIPAEPSSSSSQVGINDFYVRYHTVQLLTVLLQVGTCNASFK